MIEQANVRYAAEQRIAEKKAEEEASLNELRKVTFCEIAPTLNAPE